MDANILLSLVNTRLRDGMGTLEEIAEDLGLTQEEVVAALAAIGYHYDEDKGRFCR